MEKKYPKKKYPKILALLIIAMICLSMLGGCGTGTTKDNESTTGQVTISGQTTQQSTQAEIPVTTLKMFIREAWPGVSYDNFSNKYIQEKTHTKWDLTIASGDDVEEKLNVLLASGERPDIIQYFSDAFEQKLVTAGILYPISDSFDKAPSLAKWSSAGDGKLWDAMRFPDGKAYSVPIIEDPPIDFLPIYRQDWLDKLGLKVPTTIDEYYNVAVAIANNDPDGNGKKDTYAFGSFGVKDIRNFDIIFGAFGVMPSFYLDVNGHLLDTTIQPGTKEALRFINKLYKAGAIDPEFITDNETRYKTKFLSGMYGAACYKIYVFDTLNIVNYYKTYYENNPTAKLVTGPLLKGGCDKPLGPRALSQRGWTKTGISKDSKNIDAAIRLLDWLTSEEGVMFVNYGIEGQHYTMDNGILKPTVSGDEAKNLGIAQCYLAAHFLLKQTSVEFQDMVKYANSIYTANAADGIITDEMVKYSTDLETLRQTNFAKMMVGDLPIDGGFENFVKEWNKLGGEAMDKSVDAVYQQKK